MEMETDKMSSDFEEAKHFFEEVMDYNPDTKYDARSVLIMMSAYARHIRGEMPSPYEGELNRDRIKTYRDKADMYGTDDLVVGRFFNAGADWYRRIAMKSEKL